MSINSKVELLNNFILVLQEKGEEKTASGLYKPESAIEKKNVYVVQAVAKEVTVVSVGDKVIIDNITGNVQPIDGIEYIVTEPQYLLLRFK